MPRQPRLFPSLLVCLWGLPILAQVPTAPVEGLRDNSPRVHALVNARIVVAPGQVIPKGTLVIRNGVISQVGTMAAPTEARVWDLAGRTVYPGFIDSYSSLDLPKEWQAPQPGEENKPPELAKNGSRAWNPRVTPQRDAADNLTVDPKQTEKVRGLGFTVALVAPARGVFRGTSTLINLSGNDANKSIVRRQVAQHVAFEQSGFREAQYPDSLMGSIALIRQTFLDADWYNRAQTNYAQAPQGLERPETNSALAALAPVVTGELPVVFKAEDELDLLRVLRVAEEFKTTQSWVLGTGYEYRVLPQLAARKIPLILPLDFPEAPEVETPEKALDVDLEVLQHWEQAPSNPARLAQAGVMFALTTSQLKKPEEQFWPRVRQSVRRGLTVDQALASLTTTPAKFLGVSGRYGTLEPGKVANLVISDGDLFTSKANILSVWVDGQIYETDKGREVDPRGTWTVTWQGVQADTNLVLSGDPKPKATLGGKDTPAVLQGSQLLLFPPAQGFGPGQGTVRLTASINGDQMQGTGQLPDGQAFSWQARRTQPAAATPTPAEPSDQALTTPTTYPAGAFGRTGKPNQPEWLLVKGATIWTSGPQGRFLGDLLIQRGKISQVGPNLTAPAGAIIINAQGKHVTPGLIDCHSHTAISRGVNEGTHAVTTEVRIGDVLDPTDIAMYRELAGGLTVANLLHGSANPMGGQNQVIKLRWGEHAEGLKFTQAPAGVKFALGENVKQSNWGEKYTTRYPQTRMGVEQLLRDTFMAAQDYERAWSQSTKAIPPRRDLRLEAVLEILRGQRWVHIHSYRQDEILMFVRLAQEFKLPVATFQHVLEGYKVADAIAQIKAGGSSFSDWWGFKFEVYDAVPTNGALMKQAGVLVSFNSDSNELARRLNTEAAKAVKYGGVSEEEALKFVTLNPAQQLRIDRYVGSLEPGKDADFVLWTGSPLSSYSRTEETWIEGRKYFDRTEDQTLQQQASQQREALIQKALPERQKALALPPAPPAPAPKPTTEDLTDALEHQSPYHAGHDHHNCSNAQHRHDL
ncbi:amidohydrolase family protein [Candidatus Cyanaurora vandensis]|uniref:amidohydrolase family protein n=2 Tax=Candidatus Cyanaurora vandensis TaxID=2714958 RepID=UPI002580C4F8|nr:amidohydrolase family protein [Candidatus Cyanaurora vandensis]